MIKLVLFSTYREFGWTADYSTIRKFYVETSSGSIDGVGGVEHKVWALKKMFFCYLFSIESKQQPQWKVNTRCFRVFAA